MLMPELISQDSDERSLFLADVRSFGSITPEDRLSFGRFLCLIAGDASQTSNDVLRSFARVLIHSGAVYVCSWGRDCERVHEAVDGAALEIESDPSDDSVIMTTWHDSESLEQALWFVLNSAFPANEYLNSCNSVLAICIGDQSWSNTIRSAFGAPREFSKRILA
jgi:hypothetical protein